LKNNGYLIVEDSNKSIKLEYIKKNDLTQEDKIIQKDKKQFDEQ
jgi:hypothetical protein